MPPTARRPLALVGAATSILLLLVSARYGYHRDELYFLVAGDHPAWGYVDQPPLVPLLAHGVDAVSGGSLVALRAVAALLGGVLVVVAGLIARELGGARDAQILTAVCVAISGTTLAPAHLMTTTVVDLVVWSVLLWLVLRCIGIVREPGDGRLWLLVGAVAGIGLEAKTLVAALLVACLVALLVVGPRAPLRSWWLLGGVGIALALWAPNLAWQATHGWPQLELSRAIAEGGSATSSSPLEFVVLQLVQVSPILVLVWVPGLVRLWRDPAVRRARFLPVAYAVLFVGFLATGGKAYYMAGVYPTLLAAGSVPVLARVRRSVLAVGLAVSLVVGGVIALPVLPPTLLAKTPIPDINPDSVEMVGWPRLAATVDEAVEALPDDRSAHAVVLTSNYGEAGAVARFGGDAAPVYSGHNAFSSWGPPPAGTTTVVAVGLRPSVLSQWFGEVDVVGRIDNGLDVDNEEQGAPVVVATSPRQPWAVLWPQMRRYG
ncbi:ArnT family glycosyltransferase [Cellulomonas edaphi]|uniref:Glycosyltransferase family 39 protein n=1 Tax=Cellulomonas edaphi TaxID=3053468 RepID=A0ABT7S3V8_9CELL|nr:glycosyltransferase family 39 protein [Cellulomons edaphi]MDM7830309.1 glycosyltransferase family 39 protein [Cellulomons edaphi]